MLISLGVHGEGPLIQLVSIRREACPNATDLQKSHTDRSGIESGQAGD